MCSRSMHGRSRCHESVDHESMVMSGRLQESLVTPPTAEEVELAKAQTINSFVFNFANSTAQLQRRLVYSLIGLPPVRVG